MISQTQLAKLVALRDKKYRQRHRQFAVEGEKVVGELLAQQRVRVLKVFATAPFFEKHGAFLEKMGERATLVDEADLKKASALSTAHQAIAVCELPAPPVDLPFFGGGNLGGKSPGPNSSIPQFLDSSPPGWHFYLDGIQDPGNLGTIWRLADWFGVPCLFCSPTCADFWNPKVLQASMGAFLRVEAVELSFDEIIEKLPPGLPVIGATMDGEDIFSKNLSADRQENRPTDGGLLVIGSEGAGISSPVLEKLTGRVSVPRDPAGGAESLNAAVAAGIVMAVLKAGRFFWPSS